MKNRIIILLISSLVTPVYAIQRKLEKADERVLQEKLEAIKHANQANPSDTIHKTIKRLSDLVKRGLDKDGAVPRNKSLTQEDWDEVFGEITSEGSCENAKKNDTISN